MLVNDKTLEIKLIDFGFAEKIVRDKLISRAGTPGFLPPELFQLQPFTDKGDIFSLGVIFYALINGSAPFKGGTYKDVLELNRKCDITYTKDIWKQYSDDCIECLK